MEHPCPNMVHQKILQCQCSSEGQVVACPGRLWMVTTDFATSDYVSADGDGSISSSIQSVSSYSTLTQKTFDTNGTWSLDNFDRSSVWLCYLQQSNAWQQRSCPCSGRIWPSHCSSPRLFPTKSQHGQQVITIHLYDCFIWLFCTIAGIAPHFA